MLKKPISFNRMRQIFKKLGFVESKSPAHPPQITFVHKPTDTIFFFPLKTTQVVPLRVDSIKHIIDGRGVASEEEFETLLAKERRSAVRTSAA